MPTPAWSAMEWLTALGTTRLAVVAMETASHDNANCDVLFSAAQYAALVPTKEASSLVPSSLSLPVDILLPQWIHGRPAALDVSVISPLQHLTLTGAVSSPGKRCPPNSQPVGQPGWTFFPLSWRHWVGGVPMPSLPFVRLVKPLASS